MRRRVVSDLARRLLALLEAAARPLTARELGCAAGVRQDAAARALKPALAEGRVVVLRGAPTRGRRPRAYAMARPAAPSPARPAARERACLACGRRFKSAGAGNRLCESCRKKSLTPFDIPARVAR